jgi:hypothetical protein
MEGPTVPGWPVGFFKRNKSLPECFHASR